MRNSKKNCEATISIKDQHLKPETFSSKKCMIALGSQRKFSLSLSDCSILFLYRIEKWNDPFSRVFCSYFLFISLLPFPVFFSHNSPPLCPVALGNNHKYIMEMAMSLVSDQTFVFPSVSDSRRLGSLRWIHERVQRGVPCISSLLYS